MDEWMDGKKKKKREEKFHGQTIEETVHPTCKHD